MTISFLFFLILFKKSEQGFISTHGDFFSFLHLLLYLQIFHFSTQIPTVVQNFFSFSFLSSTIWLPILGSNSVSTLSTSKNVVSCGKGKLCTIEGDCGCWFFYFHTLFSSLAPHTCGTSQPVQSTHSTLIKQIHPSPLTEMNWIHYSQIYSSGCISLLLLINFILLSPWWQCEMCKRMCKHTTASNCCCAWFSIWNSIKQLQIGLISFN